MVMVCNLVVSIEKSENYFLPSSLMDCGQNNYCEFV